VPEHTLEGRIIRGLTLHRPWPWAFTHLPESEAKGVENRGWKPPRQMIGGWVALHSGKAFDDGAWQRMRAGFFGSAAQAVPPAGDHPDSVITVLCRLTGSYSLPGKSAVHSDPWAFGPECWELPASRRVVLPEPVPCRGAQGLWRLPDEVFERVRVQFDRIRYEQARANGMPASGRWA